MNKPRILRWLSTVIITLFALALISWLVVPPLTKHLLEQQIQAQIGRKATVDKIDFNPFTFTLKVSNFTLYEPNKVTPALSAKSLLLNTSWGSLIHLAPVINEVQLVNPNVHLIRTSAQGIGRYNYSDIIDRIQAMPKSTNTKPTLFSIANIQLIDGTIIFDDQVTHKQINIKTLNIGVPFISNFPNKIDTFVQPHLSAVINGSPFSLKGRSKPFINSLDTALAIDIDQLDVASYVPFSPVALPLDIQSSKLSTKLDLTFERKKDQPEILLSGTVKLADVALADKHAAPLFKTSSIEAQIHKLNVLNGAMALDQIDIKNPEVWTDLNAKNQLNWANLTTPAQPTKTTDTAKKAAPLPSITLEKFNLHNGTVNWRDAANASPTLDLQVKNIELNATQISLAADAKPANVTLSTGSPTDQHIQFNGQITPADGTVNGKVSVNALPLAQYQPYINPLLAATVNGQLSLDTLLAINHGQINLQQLGITLDNLKVAAKSNPTNNISAKKISLDNANINTQTQTFNADRLHLDGIQSRIQRDAQGKLNFQQFLLATNQTKKTAHKAGTQKATPNWTAAINQIAITDSTLAYRDDAVKPTVNLLANSLNLTANNISNKLDKPIQVTLKTKLNNTGSLSVDSNVAPQFKSVKANIDAKNLSVVAFQPYFTDFLNVVITTGQASAQGKLFLVPPINQQKLVTNYNGALHLANFRILDKESGDDFLKWKSLNIDGINTNMGGAHQNISADQIALSDFYARIILSETARLNLEDIVASPNTAGTPPHSLTATAPNATPVAPATPPSAPPVIAATTPAPANTPVIKIGKIIIKGGNINYTDHFVKPQYTANMTGMNGTVGTIASNQPTAAPIDIKGKIDNDAPVAISGSLNPLFKPMFLDIKGSANDVELPRLTPYATKYAGYPIEKGKLSMDVGYQIQNDKLVAQNHVRIDQLTFGDKVDSPTATKLPVQLAVALLKDRNGQINIDLPISGTLSDPQFSVGGLIFHVFVNLITKAVTSPFALIGSAFGGGDELGYAEFPAGSSTLTPATQSKLDSIAKALIDRPALKMDLIGRVDPVTDSEGVRQQILNQKILALKQKDSVNQSEDTRSDDMTISDADKQKYMSKVYSAAKFNKPKNMIGLTKSLPVADMEKLILANTPVTQDALSALATDRADAIRKYLVNKDQIPMERLFMIAPKLTADGIKDKGKPNRVDFSLK
ncbi:MAG: DUF748 domain-containing protein [Gammaproteobacteria bacterium]|nr:DUF748 domain-containing protein [Gammaproteobacteria bacterium]